MYTYLYVYTLYSDQETPARVTSIISNIYPFDNILCTFDKSIIFLTVYAIHHVIIVRNKRNLTKKSSFVKIELINSAGH